jgi:hypothetical protein
VNREQFDHAVRAAAAVLGVEEVLVIGSQAVHGSLPEPVPASAQRSVEVDVVPFDDPEGAKADLIDGSIGEASMFHETFGFYAQGVGPGTAVLPQGWQERLVRYQEPRSGVVAWCLELHDLWVSKAVAGRPKDRELCDALVAEGLVARDVLAERIDGVADLDAATRGRLAAWVAGGVSGCPPR